MDRVNKFKWLFPVLFSNNENKEFDMCILLSGFL